MSNAADRRKVQDAATREKVARRAEVASIQFLMHDPRGRQLAHRLLTQCGVDRIIGPASNAMTLARDVGIQDFGRWFLEEIRAACPEQELAMRREAAAREQALTDQEQLDNEHPES